MSWKRPLSVATAIAAAHIASTAHAAAPFAMIPARAATTSVQPSGCADAVAPAGGGALALDPAPSSLSKSSAILGGKMSKLEMMARQQASAASSSPTASLGASTSHGSGLAPAAGGISCATLAAARLQVISQAPGLMKPVAGNAEDFLASRRLTVRKTSFDRSWNRVRRAGISGEMNRSLAMATSNAGFEAKLAAVNAWTNTSIRYVEDKDLYGQADFWASANMTLRKGAGDCEDIAILKMQLLAKLGVSRDDMYLTVARDLARNADHALLVVKSGDRNWLLDNATNAVLDGNKAYDYRPIFSFSNDQKWLHGY